MTLEEMRAQRDKLNLQIQEMERAEDMRQQHCDEIERELLRTQHRFGSQPLQMHARGLVVVVEGEFPQYNCQMGTVLIYGKRTFLDVVRAAAEVIERETRG
jgi:hypothetical protein